MNPPMDLASYLRRLGVTSGVQPDLSTLRTLAASHAAAIPFENLNPLLGWPVSLDLAAVERKLVQEQRGGYCFEHNLLFGEALRAIGFEVGALAARVLWGRPEDAITPRAHMLLRIEIDSATHIADVGFGGLTLTGALRLEENLAQSTPHEPFRFVRRDDGDWRMQAQVHGEWKTLYRFDLQPQYPVDFVAPNHYLSTHPESHFVNRLIAARAAADRRYALQDRELAIHHLGGDTERRTLDSTQAVLGVLENELQIRLPRDGALERRLQRLFE
ncbi:MAG TPA: arylamine N-acetyltransferase [Albitalea sp.]